ncbi:Uncharacterized protein Fot_40411 [Forsythia ovata]|uniref:Uncharacterized protein n=1 Tax=Forsythia ovata TaxID=205694 RepID=A0ABD1S7D3_9LAMI
MQGLLEWQRAEASIWTPCFNPGYSSFAEEHRSESTIRRELQNGVEDRGDMTSGPTYSTLIRSRHDQEKSWANREQLSSSGRDCVHVESRYVTVYELEHTCVPGTYILCRIKCCPASCDASHNPIAPSIQSDLPYSTSSIVNLNLVYKSWQVCSGKCSGNVLYNYKNKRFVKVYKSTSAKID